MSKKTFRCDNCGDMFEKYESKIRDNQENIFCSRDCKNEYGSVSVSCNTCGSTISKTKNQFERNKHNYCSQECYFKSGREIVECDECGETVEKISYRSNTKYDFCSRKCCQKHFRGKNHPDWEGGKEVYYGANWRKMRQRALERDNNLCLLCGKSGEQQSLHVHHIKPLKTFDEPEDANYLDNLVSLCPSCHGEVESLPIHVQQKEFGISDN